MFKKVIIIIAALSLFIFLGLLFLKLNPEKQIMNTQVSKQKDTFLPYKAKFAIYTNGTLRIFTDPRYHNKSKDVYLTLDAPETINVEKENTTWQAFFDTLPMKVNKDCLITGTGQKFCTNSNYQLQFFLNGKKDQDSLSQKINKNDNLLVTYESIDSPSIYAQLEYLNNL